MNGTAHPFSASSVGRFVDKVVEEVRSPPCSADAVLAHVDRLTKPPGSLGRFEDLAVKVGTIYGDPPAPFADVAVFVLAADHGVARRGVSAYPPEVTAQMCANFDAGGAAINVFAECVGARVVVVDMGVAADLGHLSSVVDRKIRLGTDDLAEGPAMTVAEAEQGIAHGIGFVHPEPPDLVVIGEMGIGNTTAAAAVVSALTGTDPRAVVGPGTGIDRDRLCAKQEVVARAVGRVGSEASPVAVLAEVGGFEIAGIAGIVLGAAREGRAIVVDGFISAAGALVAAALCPVVRDYLIASHRSAEPGHTVALEALGIEPYLDWGLRLGEGSGGALFVPHVRAAAAMLREMATFESAGVSGPEAEGHESVDDTKETRASGGSGTR